MVTSTDTAPTACQALYGALSDTDRDAVDLRRALGEDLVAALAGVGLLLPAPADETAARARRIVADESGVELLAVEDTDGTWVAVTPPSRQAAAVVAAAGV
ncbi:hypothetical protein P1P68_22220 [Streptomyces scabiei]|uniref:hypothetical protein n=1 Tax=Streptomyces scabiei TaxID=1930 RepID=UPI00298FCC1B|nr:hypothetical protein [Streptomyces scabiei]MDW8807426.1 hypothetical protein [Streptomyces scabiei]